MELFPNLEDLPFIYKFISLIQIFDMGGLASEIIRDNLGEKTLQKIEERLHDLYGLSINESNIEFAKIDAVLREFFGEGAEGLEARIINASKGQNHNKKF